MLEFFASYLKKKKIIVYSKVMFSSRNLIVLPFRFVSVIPLEASSVYSVIRIKVKFFNSMNNLFFPPRLYVKRIFFPPLI